MMGGYSNAPQNRKFILRDAASLVALAQFALVVVGGVYSYLNLSSIVNDVRARIERIEQVGSYGCREANAVQDGRLKVMEEKIEEMLDRHRSEDKYYLQHKGRTN